MKIRDEGKGTRINRTVGENKYCKNTIRFIPNDQNEMVSLPNNSSSTRKNELIKECSI